MALAPAETLRHLDRLRTDGGEGRRGMLSWMLVLGWMKVEGWVSFGSDWAGGSAWRTRGLGRMMEAVDVTAEVGKDGLQQDQPWGVSAWVLES